MTGHHTLRSVADALADGRAVPYLGPGMLALSGPDCPVPATPEALVERLTEKASVPHKIRNNLTAAAQFIETFKHRRTLVASMTGTFRVDVVPTAVHSWLAAWPSLPMVVHGWYDDLPQRALSARRSWGMAQGVSKAEHSGDWVHYFSADGAAANADDVDGWETLLYQPFGSIWPSANFLVSDSDFVEVLTEIDIQTPIPEPVVRRRRDRHFLFLGCRFATQNERIFASQIMKRSSDRHWAVLPEEPTRNEARFLRQLGIERIDMALGEFVHAFDPTCGAEG